MRFARRAGSLLLAGVLAVGWAGCGGVADDLYPSGEDERSTADPTAVGPQVGQVAPDFTAPDTFGGAFTLSEVLPGTRAVVLYFTMWCPICDSHMSHLRDGFVPRYPDVAFVAVDYVSGSVADARSAQNAHGFAGGAFEVLVDLEGVVTADYDATMGTTVVIDAVGTVRMNEDYKNGERLDAVLRGLP